MSAVVVPAPRLVQELRRLLGSWQGTADAAARRAAETGRPSVERCALAMQARAQRACIGGLLDAKTNSCDRGS